MAWAHAGTTKIAMAKMDKKNLSQPDETRTFDNGKLELVTVGGVTFGRATFQSGWKWSTSIKPLVKTKSYEAPHVQYHVSGRLHVVMDDGSEEEFGPGDSHTCLQAMMPGSWMTAP